MSYHFSKSLFGLFLRCSRARGFLWDCTIILGLLVGVWYRSIFLVDIPQYFQRLFSSVFRRGLFLCSLFPSSLQDLRGNLKAKISGEKNSHIENSHSDDLGAVSHVEASNEKDKDMNSRESPELIIESTTDPINGDNPSVKGGLDDWNMVSFR